jgi:hypothetical protein
MVVEKTIWLSLALIAVEILVGWCSANKIETESRTDASENT